MPGRPDQQHALRDAAAELLELLRLLQELDDLLQLFLGFVDAGHVLERDLLLLRGEQAGAALAEAQRLVPAALHLAHHEDPERQQQDEGDGVDQHRTQVPELVSLMSMLTPVIVQQRVHVG